MAFTQTTSVFVDSISGVISLIEKIVKVQSEAPNLFIDLEGLSLSRHGSISILTIYAVSESCAYLVDIHTLGPAAFTTCGPSGTTLKSILESPLITKVFFDVRNDSDALYAHFGIQLEGIEDVQLMENACRSKGHRQFVTGLDKTIQRFAPLTEDEKAAWSIVKDKGQGLFRESRGGTCEVFNQRPMDPDVLEYCINDVKLLPALRDTLWEKLWPQWRRRVVIETRNRVRESQSASYDPDSKDKILGPWERDIAVVQ